MVFGDERIYLTSGRKGTLNNAGLWASEGSGSASGKEESSNLHGGKGQEKMLIYADDLGHATGSTCSLQVYFFA
jgi:hypothetical protein